MHTGDSARDDRAAVPLHRPDVGTRRRERMLEVIAALVVAGGGTWAIQRGSSIILSIAVVFALRDAVGRL
jgi:hypothetical protein